MVPWCGIESLLQSVAGCHLLQGAVGGEFNSNCCSMRFDGKFTSICCRVQWDGKVTFICCMVLRDGKFTFICCRL